MRISASIDDGCKHDLKLAHLFEKYEIDAVFYWPANTVMLAEQKGWDALTPQEEAAIAKKFEIGSHGVTHAYLTRIPMREAIDEIRDSRSMLQAMHGQEIKKFCYPRGYANAELREVVKQAGYESARSTIIGHIGEQKDPYFEASAVHIGCPVRPEYEGTTWQDYGLRLFRQAKEQNKDYHFWGHSWEIDKYGEWDNVEEFIKELVK